MNNPIKFGVCQLFDGQLWIFISREKIDEKASTHQFQHVSNFCQNIVVEVVEERNGLQEPDILLDPLEAGAHHDLLECSTVQDPDAGVRFDSCRAEIYSRYSAFVWDDMQIRSRLGNFVIVTASLEILTPSLT